MNTEGGARMTPLGRVITAMVTPFDDDLRIDLEAAARLADYLMNNGSDGIVVSGTTGESPTLTTREKLDLVNEVKNAVGGRGKVIAGTGSNSTAASIELTKQATTAGADAIMLVVPYYNRPPQEGLYRHFAAAAASTDLPIILYNVPSRTSCCMDVDTVVRLAEEVPNIVALKEAGGNLTEVAKAVDHTPDDFYVFSGEDELNLPYLAMGANGFISVTAHVVGNQLRSMCEAFAGGRTGEALRIHNEVLPVTKALFAATNPIMVKEAMNMLGQSVGGLRPPLIEATPEQQELLRKELKALNLI